MGALRLPGRGERLAPLLSALLLALSFPPLHPLVLPFVGLVPLVVWLHGLPGSDGGRGAAARGGFLFGAVYFGLLFHWIPIAIVGRGGSAAPADAGTLLLAVLAFAVIVVGLAGMAALSVVLLHHAVRVVGAPLWLAVPVVWTALEWSRAHLPSTLALPWLGLGTSLTGYPELVGIAELVGARGVTFWLATVNGLAATILIGVRRASRAADGRAGGARALAWAVPAAWTVAVVLLPMLWGVWRAGSLETSTVARVAVVQPNVEGRAKVDAAAMRAAAVPDGAAGGRALGPVADLGAVGASREDAGLQDRLARLGSRLGPGGVDFVVLPEGAVRAFPGSSDGAQALAPLRALSRQVRAPVLFGGLGFAETEAGDDVFFNSAFLMEPEGLTDFRYDKRRLVPVVERVPLLPRRWSAALHDLGAYGVGRGRPLARAGGVAYGVLVCYEASYPGEARAFRLAGADVLVNITNDAWFGGEPLHSRTVALWQHPAHLVMRAIENRMGVVRSANTGVSLFVDPVGRVEERTALFTQDVRIAEVRTTDVRTFYSRHGDLLGNASVLATLALLLLAASAWRHPWTRVVE